jgi:predicted metalloprotease
MKLDDSRRSDNVEDQRGSGLSGKGGAVGIGTLLIVIVGYFMGVNPQTLMSLLNGGVQQPVGVQRPAGPPADTATNPQVDFVRAILGETEDVWGKYFKNAGSTYIPPKLVLFTGVTSSGCGNASASMGPFYCPGDQKVYIDLAFFRQLATQFGAPGQFAQAYVIAHEVGHHVQNLLGITTKASRLESRGGATGAGGISVRVELQADCFAGVWADKANQAHKILEPGDLEQGRLLGGRRYVAKARARQRRAGQLHPRLLGAAREVVSPRFRERRHQYVRYLQRGGRALAARGLCGGEVATWRASLRGARPIPESSGGRTTR